MGWNGKKLDFLKAFLDSFSESDYSKSISIFLQQSRYPRDQIEEFKTAFSKGFEPLFARQVQTVQTNKQTTPMQSPFFKFCFKNSPLGNPRQRSINLVLSNGRFL